MKSENFQWVLAKVRVTILKDFPAEVRKKDFTSPLKDFVRIYKFFFPKKFWGKPSEKKIVFFKKFWKKNGTLKRQDS